MKNKVIWISFGIISHLLSWVSPLVFAIVRYGAFIQKHSVPAIFASAAALGIVLMLRALKEQAEVGYGLFRRIARSIRLVIPLLVLFMFILVINKNIADLYDVILFTLGANIIAQPFSIISYYCGPAYIEDTSGNKILEKIK